MGKIECSGEETKLEGWRREDRKGKSQEEEGSEDGRGNYNNSKKYMAMII